MKQPIRNTFSGKVQFEAEIDACEDTHISIRIGLAVRWGHRNEADLSWTNLSWANLSRVDLSWANLSRVDLSWANLSGTNLSGANLSRANLPGANLSRANLPGADLSWANLSWANLSGANLSWANLSGTNLSWANLSGANLSRACLSQIDRWKWAKENAVFLCAIEGRTLIVGRRSRKSLNVGSQDYSAPGVYRAVVFSSDTSTECHPGLYLAGMADSAEDWILCACWLDEGVALKKGWRTSRFRKLETEDADQAEAEVAGWALDCLDAEDTLVKGWVEKEEE